MTSEHRFASVYGSVWQNVLPLADAYWRTENRCAERVFEPLKNRVAPGTRGLVNELAFIAYVALSGGEPDRFELGEVVRSSIDEAVKYVNRVSAGPPMEIADVDEVCVREATRIALRLHSYFRTLGPVVVRPRFRGCGLLTDAEGDVLADDCLFEIKAGDRYFRMIDLRQLLIYSALAYSSGRLNFSDVSLFNPRTGLLWRRSLDEVCRSVSGLRSTDVLSSLIAEMTSTEVSR